MEVDMKWFRSLSTIAKIGVIFGIFVLCGLISRLAPSEQISNDDLVSSAVAQMQQDADATTQVSQAANPTTALPTETLLPTDTTEPTATTNPNLFNAGTYLIGTDMQPGLYRGNAGTDFLDSCYWERLSGLSGEFDDIIANDNAVGQYYIEVTGTDIALTVQCGVELLPTLVVNDAGFPETIGTGTYLVGYDVQPGTYQGQAGTDFDTSCYWARLSGASGEFSDLIANDNATGQFYVQISPSDFAILTKCDLTYVSQ
jgi:outer membrane murein-binding lipoprotein Lpp